MSKKNKRRKKLRNPSPEAVADFAKKRQKQIEEEQAAQRAEAAREEPDAENLSPAERRRIHDEKLMACLTPEEREQWAQQGEKVYEQMCRMFALPKGDMTEEEVNGSLDTCVRFLTQVAECASGVMATLNTEVVRKIFAADVPLTVSARLSLKAAGFGDVVEDSEESPANAAHSSPQKRPRGSSHPLVVLIKLGIQASRLVNQITKTVWPHAHNKYSLDEKKDKGGGLKLSELTL